MKLKLTDKGELNISQQKKKDASRRGRTSKAKGANFERAVAKKLKDVYGVEFVRTPLSGGFLKNKIKSQDFKGDIVPADKNVICVLHMEIKSQKIWSLPAWLKQAENDAPENSYPCVITHLHNTSKDYIMMGLDDFLRIVPEETIITHLEGVVS